MNSNKNSKLKIKKITLETYIHETEDPEKVSKSLQFLLPTITQEKDDSIKITEKKFYGHWNNIIRSLQAEISAKKCSETFQQILDGLPEDQKKRLHETLDRQFNESKMTFYLRLNKQSLISGQLQLREGSDIIHITIKFLVHGKGSERSKIVKSYLQNSLLGGEKNE
ncbi:MAG: RNA-binding domain-containing protein [Candidatus Hodarchaeota archaeon]